MKKLLFLLTLLIIIIMTFLKLKDFFSSDKKQVELLLGTKLKNKPDEVNLYKWQPNPNIVFNYSYFKVRLSLEDYQTLISLPEWQYGENNPETHIYLPSEWATDKLPETVRWWDPSNQTPKNAACRKISDNKWVIVKLENNYLYGIYTEN